MRGIEKVGGKLLLTDQRLVFKSHKLNIQSDETHLMITEIKEAIPRKTSNFYPNGIRIIKTTGDHLDIFVHERDNWISKINHP